MNPVISTRIVKIDNPVKTKKQDKFPLVAQGASHHVPQTIFCVLKEHLPLVLMEEIMSFLPRLFQSYFYTTYNEPTWCHQMDWMAFLSQSLILPKKYTLAVSEYSGHQYVGYPLEFHRDNMFKFPEKPTWQLLSVPTKVLVIAHVAESNQSNVWVFSNELRQWLLVSNECFKGKAYGYLPCPEESTCTSFVLRTDKKWRLFSGGLLTGGWHTPIVRFPWLGTPLVKPLHPGNTPLDWWLPDQHRFAPPMCQWDPPYCPFVKSLAMPPLNVRGSVLVYVVDPKSGLGITKNNKGRYFLTQTQEIKCVFPKGWEWMFPNALGECMFRDQKDTQVEWFCVDPWQGTQRVLSPPPLFSDRQTFYRSSDGKLKGDIPPAGNVHPLWRFSANEVKGTYTPGMGHTVSRVQETWIFPT